MERVNRIHKNLTFTSLILLILSLVPLVFFFIKNNSKILAPFLILIYFSFNTYATSYVLVNVNKKWIKNTTKYTLIFYPLIFLSIPFIMKYNNIFILIFIGSIFLIITSIALLRLFLFEKPTSIRLTIILLGLVILTLLWKKFHLLLGSLVMAISISWFAIGIFIFGIRCLFLIENNKYFRRLSLFAAILITVTFIGLLFKLNHWPIGGALLGLSALLLIVGSFIVLLSLPYAGYIDWPQMHKKILGKFLYPWIFILFLFLFKQLTPGAWNQFWGATAKEEKVHPGFEMVDYPVENKNGLE